MSQQSKNRIDYSDRELLELIAIKSSEAARAAKWVKGYIIIGSIIALLIFVLQLSLSLGVFF